MVLFIPTVVLDGDTRKLFHCSIEMGRRYEVFVDGDTVHAGTYACVDKKPMDKICFKTFGNEVGILLSPPPLVWSASSDSELFLRSGNALRRGYKLGMNP